MKATAPATSPPAENIVPLSIVPAPPKPKRLKPPPSATPGKDRFRVIDFINRSGSKSWRVTGSTPQGKQVRKNFNDEERAKAERLKLEAEHLARPVPIQLSQRTHLSAEQIKIAESAFAQLDDPQDMLAAIHHWRHTGKPKAAIEAPRLDDAVEQFVEWLTATPALRQRTKDNLRVRATMFASGTGNVLVNEITSDGIDAYLTGRNVSPSSRDNDRRALSRFFTWCMERPRRWCAFNPCAAVKVEQGEKPAPVILDLATCKRLLGAAEKHKAGKLAAYVAVALFGGMRPFEIRRLTWAKVNMDDDEIRLDATDTKTGRGRVVPIGPTLKRWLATYKGKPFYPPGWRKDFDKIKLAIGYGTRTEEKPELKPWVEDVLRHTSISHHFRKTESYGKCAEMFGNSESVIKAHYQGRVSSEDAKKFFALMPGRKGR